jgi:hypothetical protein
MMQLVRVPLVRFFLLIDDVSVCVEEFPIALDANDTLRVHLKPKVYDPLANVDSLQLCANERQ